jgi:hypothetical protein
MDKVLDKFSEKSKYIYYDCYILELFILSSHWTIKKGIIQWEDRINNSNYNIQN